MSVKEVVIRNILQVSLYGATIQKSTIDNEIALTEQFFKRHNLEKEGNLGNDSHNDLRSTLGRASVRSANLLQSG